MEDVAAQTAAIFDASHLEVVNDPTNPAAANRDAGGTMVPKPYRPG
jgi:hypothetical protein